MLNQAASGLAILLTRAAVICMLTLQALYQHLLATEHWLLYARKVTFLVNSYTPLSVLTPTACTSTAVALPQRN